MTDDYLHFLILMVLSLFMIEKIQKRNGAIVSFNFEKITNAIYLAMIETDKSLERKHAEEITEKIKNKLTEKKEIINVEKIQDLVEEELMSNEYMKVAKAYILYRQKRADLRENKKVSDELENLSKESQKYFPNLLSEFVYYATYSRWIQKENRRETWVETIDRYISFMKESIKDKLTEKEYEEIREYMLNMKTMGSMRLLWAAGDAVRATNVAAYNCAFIAPMKWQDFGEIAYILMCGTGVGFSVEEHVIAHLPMIEYQNKEKIKTAIIDDSKEGWADAIVQGLKTWSEGKDISFDYSKIRAQGARLKTMGGRASGPDPLRLLLIYIKEKILSRQGRRFSTIDVHDIICKIGEIVVMGGVRRSALISLSDLDDNSMREAKNGQFYLTHPERMMANNSVIYNTKPSSERFLEEWLNLIKGQSGERGIFNRGSLEKQLPARRWDVFEKNLKTSGTNPCAEIVLQSKQLCNLSEVIARQEDTEKTLMNKIRIATILGTYQSTLTNFPYLSKEWKKNCEEERLLGVSITGQWDCPVLRNPSTLRKLKEVAIETNKKYARRFGINESTAITCVKPSGNGSQLFDSSSGCHPRHSKYYIRRVRIEGHNPIFHMLRDSGMPFYPEVGQHKETSNTFVLEFPMRSPKKAITRNNLNAMEHLEYWKILKENYTEHNPSVTISVLENEWIKVSNWVYENWELIAGLSFLPKSDHVYKLAPYEEISREKYYQMVKTFPKIDFSKIVLYEYDDTTSGSKELACVANLCEIDLPNDVSPKTKNI